MTSSTALIEFFNGTVDTSSFYSYVPTIGTVVLVIGILGLIGVAFYISYNFIKDKKT